MSYNLFDRFIINVVVNFCTLDEDKELPVGNLSVLDFATSLSFIFFSIEFSIVVL